ncbi:MAG TPA: hypothetical protein VFG33_05255, partial [Kribbella sp.]|uniref:hypothetical protein n=1 Tax=Kribbella sp. TaxID=1871183 RepID=UPI002D792ED9
MGLTATYDPILSRIRLAATALGATADHALVWRTTDNYITYTLIRGANPAAISGGGGVLNIDDYEFVPGVLLGYQIASYNAAGVLQASFTTTITQDLTAIWMKVPAAPFLNREVEASVRFPISRRARSSLFDVVGRTMPVAVSDIGSSREFTLQLRTESASDERDLDYLFASGEVLLLQRPAVMDQFPGGYFAHGDVSREPGPDAEFYMFPERRYWQVPLTEVAIPGPAVVGSAYTIASMLAEYATITAVLAGNATIA